MSRFGFLFTIVLGLAPVAFSDVVYDEFDMGDSSSNVNAPLNLGVLTMDENTIIGAMDNVNNFPLDRDFYTFQIPAGRQMDGIILDEVDGDLHFFGLDDAATVSQVAGDLLIATLISSGQGGENLFDVPLDFAAQGVTGPLGPGNYTIQLQETDTDVFHNYTLTIQTSPVAVPEPSSFLAIAAVVGVLGYRRRKKQ